MKEMPRCFYYDGHDKYGMVGLPPAMKYRVAGAASWDSHTSSHSTLVSNVRNCYHHIMQHMMTMVYFILRAKETMLCFYYAGLDK